MLAVFFLFSIFINGFIVIRTFFPKATPILPLSFFVGSLLSVTMAFVLLFISHSLQTALIVYFVVLAVILVVVRAKLRVDKSLIKGRDLLIYGVVSVLAFLAFEKSFSYSASSFLIQSNLYQDFGAHIPIIRYFSGGENYIPEVPFFAGKNLLYHFMFDFYAGILEFLGMRIDIALNVISSLTLASLFWIVISFSKLLFKNVYVGVLACGLFILNSDLSFINLLSQYGLSFNGLMSIYHHNAYPQGNILGLMISGNFLNVNALLNQRQLLFGLLAVFSLAYLLLALQGKLNTRQTLFFSVLIGLLPFWHISALISVYLILFGMFVFLKEYRRTILRIVIYSLILVAPQIYLIKLNSVNQIIFNPGFLIAKNLSVTNFALFWVWNLGFLIPLIIIGFIKSDAFRKKIFLAFLPLFIVPNLFQFSKDIFDNHKFFNVLILLLCIFGAYGFVILLKEKVPIKIAAVLLVILATMSGIFHLLVVKNDVYAKIPDPKEVRMFNQLDERSILLTNGEIYDPASLAGFKTFLGRPQYVFLYGGDPAERLKQRITVFEGKKDKEIRRILKANSISYIIVYKDKSVPNLIPANNKYLDSNYEKIYENNFASVYKI